MRAPNLINFSYEETVTEISITAPMEQEETTQKTKKHFLDWLLSWSFIKLTFLMPIFFLPWSTEVLELSKQTLLIITALWVAMLYTIKIAVTKTWRIKGNMVYVGGLVFFATWVLASLFSHYPYASLVGLEGQEFLSLTTIGALGILLFIGVNTLSKRDGKNILTALLLSATTVSVFGLMQLYNIFTLPWDFAKTNAFNTIGIPSIWGAFAAITLCVAVSKTIIASVNKKIIPALFLSLFCVLQLAVLLILDDWRVWLASAIGLLTMSVVLFIKAPQKQKVSLVATPAVIAVLSVIMTIAPLPKIISLPLEVTPSLQSSASIAKETVKESPLFGYGPGTFIQSYAKFHSKELNKVNYFQFWNSQFEQSGSELATKFAGAGIVGMIGLLAFSFMLLWWMLVYLTKKPLDTEYLGMTGIVSALMAGGVIKVLLSSNMSLVYTTWILGALFLAMSVPVIKQVNARSKRFTTVSVIACALILLGSATGTWASVQRFVADEIFAQGLQADQQLAKQKEGSKKIEQKDTEKLTKTLETAVRLNPYHHAYPRVLSQAIIYRLSLAPAEEAAKNTQTIGQLAQWSVDYAKIALDLNPHDSRNTANIAAVYQAIMPLIKGAETFGANYYHDSITLEPNSPRLHLQLGNLYYTFSQISQNRQTSTTVVSEKTQYANQSTKALKNAEKEYKLAIELKPDYAQSYYQLALVRNQEQNTSEAVRMLDLAMKYNVELYKIDQADAELFYSIGLGYKDLKEFAKAEQALSAAVQIAPNSKEMMYQLALINEQNGKRDEALKIINYLLQTDPNNPALHTRLIELQKDTTISPIKPPPPATSTKKKK